MIPSSLVHSRTENGERFLMGINEKSKMTLAEFFAKGRQRDEASQEGSSKK